MALNAEPPQFKAAGAFPMWPFFIGFQGEEFPRGDARADQALASTSAVFFSGRSS